MRTTAAISLLCLAASTVRGQSVNIDHQPVGCLVADHFPEMTACFTPSSDVARARLQFRAAGTVPWYFVEMQAGGACSTAILPKPTASTKAIEYYIDVASKGYGESRTQDYAPRVASGIAGCKRKGIVAAFASTGAVKVFAPTGAPSVPAGFSGAGVTTISGAATGPTAAASGGPGGSGGGGGDASAASKKGNADKAKVESGGGGGGGALIALGVVGLGAAGAAVYVAQKGGEAEPTPDPRPTPGGPGIGDVSFRLRWTGPADLDLHVQEPNGNVINFLNPMSTTGGRLDVDSNAGCTPSTAPVENIFWPTGQAPRGTYLFSVFYFDQCNDGTAKPFTLEVRRGSNIVETQTGTVSPKQQSRQFAYVY